MTNIVDSPRISSQSCSNQTIFYYPKIVSSINVPFEKNYRRLWIRTNIMRSFEPIYLSNASRISDKTSYEQVSIITLYNVLCRADLSFYYNNTIYLFDFECKPRYWNYSSPQILDIRYKEYDSVVCIGHQHSSDFGHFICEVLPCLFVVPRSILSKSFIALPKINQFVVDGLNLLNVSKKQIISGEDLYFYARNFTTVYASMCGFTDQSLLLNFRSKVVQILSLDKITPFRHVLFNRKKTFSRYISNFDEIIQAAQQKYANITFEDGVYHYRLCDQFKYFNEIKLLVSVHASLLSNIIFMQESAYVVEIQMETIFNIFRLVGVATGKKMIYVRDKNIKYRGVINNVANVTEVMTGIDFAVSCMYNRDQFHEVFNDEPY